MKKEGGEMRETLGLMQDPGRTLAGSNYRSHGYVHGGR